MEIKCILCGIPLECDESNICETCFDVLKTKYPSKKELDKALQWHKKYTQLNKKR